MFGLKFLKKRRQRKENLIVIAQRISRNQETVYRAVEALHCPVSGRMVAAQLDWDSASVTNRLSELVKKGRIRVAYRKKGLDGTWRNYYLVKN